MNKNLYIINTSDTGEKLIGVLKGERVFSLELLPDGLKVPFSELLKFTANSMGFQPSQCVFVTDRAEGIQAAREAGMQTVTGVSAMTSVMDAA